MYGEVTSRNARLIAEVTSYLTLENSPKKARALIG